MRVKLADAFELQMGKTPDRSDASCWNGAHKWVSIADLTKAGKCITETKETISDLGVSKSGIKQVPKGTVIMSFKLSIGKTAITTEDLYTNEAIMAFIDKGIYDIDTDYIYHLFASKDWSNGTNKAVLGLTLNKATLGQIEIEIPPITEQKQAVIVLDKVDQLISLRKKQLQKLDDLVKSRFFEMFGDPEYNSKAWSIYPLEKLCTVGSSKRIYQNEQSIKGVPFWRISDLVCKMDTGNAESGLFIPEEKYIELKISGLVPNTGDILVTSRGTLGRCYIVKKEDCFYFQDGMISWLSHFSDDITPLYLKYLFEMPGIKKQIDEMQAGSTVAYLSIAMLKKLKIMVPSRAAQNDFSKIINQIDESKQTIQHGLDKLEQMKQVLMQKYFG